MLLGSKAASGPAISRLLILCSRHALRQPARPAVAFKGQHVFDDRIHFLCQFCHIQLLQLAALPFCSLHNRILPGNCAAGGLSLNRLPRRLQGRYGLDWAWKRGRGVGYRQGCLVALIHARRLCGDGLRPRWARCKAWRSRSRCKAQGQMLPPRRRQGLDDGLQASLGRHWHLPIGPSALDLAGGRESWYDQGVSWSRMLIAA